MRSEPAPGPAVRTSFEALWSEVRELLLRAVSGRVRGPGPPRPVLVGIDGRSGSGKTDLAACLEDALGASGLTCGLVHLDDLYPGWSGLAAGLRPLCADVVTPLLRGEAGAYVPWDWVASQPGPLRTVPLRDVVVLEGVGALACPCAADLDLRVWLDAPATVRRQRALDRDGEVFAPHWQEWAEQEEALFASGRPPADVVADTLAGSVRWT